MKLRSFASLNAVIRPERLPSITQFDLLIGLLASVARCEGRMSLWVPILREDDVLKALRNSVDRRDDSISARNRQLPAGTEIVLHVDDNEDVLGSDLQ